MDNYNEIKKSFGRQASKFSAYHMSKKEYTDYLIKRIEADGTEHALEVAAGTCICGRALSPYVNDIECLDLTEEMPAQGRRLAEEQGLENISFVEGNAEALPYEDEVFDLVVTRLSLHHFVKPEVPFKEMQRVLKHSGKLVIWDMAATDEALRDVDDSIERMRDPSHTRILSNFLTKNQFYFSVSTIEALGFLSIDFFILAVFYYLLKVVDKDRFQVFCNMSRDVNTIYITHWVILGFIDAIFGYLLGFVMNYLVIYSIGIILIPVSYFIAEIYRKRLKSKA